MHVPLCRRPLLFSSFLFALLRNKKIQTREEEHTVRRSRRGEREKMLTSSRRETGSSGSSNSTAGNKKSSGTSGSNSIGCMSGIFYFLSRHHHSHSRKRLTHSNTSGRKNKRSTSPSKPAPPEKKQPPPLPPPEPLPPPPPTKPDSGARDLRRKYSCDSPRSPTLPPQLRRHQISPAAEPPPLDGSPRRQPALVARLMGLDEGPICSPPSPCSAAEKRRRLLGALDKCDRDLRALKRIIEAVQSAEATAVSGPTVHQFDESPQSVKCSEANAEQPSPVSVLDAISSPIYRPKNVTQSGCPATAVRSRMSELCRVGPLFSGDRQRMKRNTRESNSLRHRIAMESLPWVMFESREGKAMEDNFVSARRREKVKGGWRQWRWRRSGAMVASVDEVWEEGAYKERCEFERVGVGLEGYIFRDLVEETVKELLGWYLGEVSVLHEKCRKRLSF